MLSGIPFPYRNHSRRNRLTSRAKALILFGTLLTLLLLTVGGIYLQLRELYAVPTSPQITWETTQGVRFQGPVQLESKDQE